MAMDVLHGMTASPRRVSPKYFYDHHGSRLFDQICDTPEYYLTRTEFALLEQHASEILAISQPRHLLELGSGTSRKTRLLLNQLEGRDEEVGYWPMDVSTRMLTHTARDLANEFPNLGIHALIGDYSAGFADLPPRDGPTLCLFLGSTLGNFEQPEAVRFIKDVRGLLRPGDFFLLGADLDKDPAVLTAAYNDKQGLTAQFNKNMLRVINERMQADFDPRSFEHRAIYNESCRQIEMYLDATEAQSVTIEAIDLTVKFAPGDFIWTEISRKFRSTDIDELFALAGFRTRARFVALQFPYALTLGVVD